VKLSDFKALTFDCYGTLIDWEAGLSEAWAPLRAAAGVGDDALFRLFGRLESVQQAATPSMLYPEVLAAVYGDMAEALGVRVSDAACTRFGGSVGDWPAFADTVEALRYLRGHFRLFVLSNVDRGSFAVSAARMGVSFDGVFTAQDIGSYKPDTRNFEYLLARMGELNIGRGELLHVAQSLFHDHVPAGRLGIASAWIDRRAGTGGGATAEAEGEVGYAFRFDTLGALAKAHREGK
jgi:2-haloacid dehalogenase